MILCPGCGFSNLDTQKNCVRCKRLLFAEPIDCNPPRAKKYSKRLRNFYFGLRRRFGFRYRPEYVYDAERDKDGERRSILSRIAEATGLDRFQLPPGPWLWPVNFVLPGIWQIAAGRPIRGIIFSTGFLLGMIAIASLIGTVQPLGWAIGFTATVQTNAICDMMDFNHLPFARRLAMVSVIAVVAFFGYYRLDERGLDTVLDWSCPDRITVYRAGEENVVRDGEIVEFKRLAGNDYRTGDLVVERNGQFNQANLLRVLAAPGDNCQVIGRNLHVNGVARAALGNDTRNLAGTLANADYIVRPVVPQVTAYYYRHDNYDMVWKASGNTFEGKAVRVVYPWWKRRPLQ